MFHHKDIYISLGIRGCNMTHVFEEELLARVDDGKFGPRKLDV